MHLRQAFAVALAATAAIGGCGLFDTDARLEGAFVMTECHTPQRGAGVSTLPCVVPTEFFDMRIDSGRMTFSDNSVTWAFHAALISTTDTTAFDTGGTSTFAVSGDSVHFTNSDDNGPGTFFWDHGSVLRGQSGAYDITYRRH